MQLPLEFAMLRVGDRLPQLAIRNNGFWVDFVGGTLHIATLVYAPGALVQNRADISLHSIHLATGTYRNKAMVFATKLGSLEWQDTVYAPWLTADEDLPKNAPLAPGDALPAIHLLVDSSTGRILQIVPFALSTSFSNSLISNIYKLKQESFDKAEYKTTVKNIQLLYPTSRNVAERLCSEFYKFTPNNQ